MTPCCSLLMAFSSGGTARDLQAMKRGLPPTPPDTEESESNESDRVELPLPPPSTAPERVLDVDKKTPDHHVPRDPRLIRLTGVHPFNVEPPLSALYDQGFLTTPELSYVRNHGAVPQVYDADVLDWEFSVEGLVKEPFTISLRALMSDFEQVTYPVTLVCAGNRRKEQNQVRKSKGFSWGAAGVCNSLFTGVVMGEVLKRAKPLRKARFVCMEGADKLPNGFYGTSVKLNWAMDPNRGLMLAYKMNGEMLRPDHGRPLRAVVPGQIGGRSVKWLKKLILTAAPSDNWYHIYDNRVLPTMVSPEESASNAEWWKDDRYAIYDLNVNSAITYPAHEERINITTSPEKYQCRGYAYGGGGRRITRVEISLDKGRSWRLATIEYGEDQYRDAEEQQLFGGKLDMSWRETCFCWCFWSLDIPVHELRDAPDMFVRAMDEAMNVQPRDMYWSVLGMMNNPWFRVTITKEGDELRFEHPTLPALMPGGWMERVKKAGGDLANGFWGEKIGGEQSILPAIEEAKEVVMIKEGLKKAVTIDELRQHDKADEPWFVVNGEVYNGTGFLEGHPGGAQSIISAAGLDSTDEFMAIHSETAKALMPSYHIGTLDAASRRALAEGPTQPDEPVATRSTFLDPRLWTSALLTAKKSLSHDTRLFTFTLGHASQALGLPVGQHLMIRLSTPTSPSPIIRAYTPLSPPSLPGLLHVLVKIYPATSTSPGGAMTVALDSLPLNASVDFKGPIGKFTYQGRGRCAIHGKERLVRRFVMICAGSGVTPILAVLRAVMEDGEDETRCLVLDGNRGEEDILCREELDEFMGERCRLLHTLSNGTAAWEGRRGRITAEMVTSELHADREKAGDETGDGDTMILICGPPALEKSLHMGLNERGWKDEDLLFF